MVMVCVGQVLGDLLQVVFFVEMFIIGLLVDIGCFGLVLVCFKWYGELLVSGVQGSQLCQEEKVLFGFYYLELVVVMMQDWYFFKFFCEMVLYYYDVDNIGMDEEDCQQCLICLLELVVCVVDVCVVSDVVWLVLLLCLLVLGECFELLFFSLEYLCGCVLWDWSDWGVLFKVLIWVLCEIGIELVVVVEKLE